MNQILGFLTAFFVVGWAVRWYFRQGNPTPKIEWQSPKEDTILPGVTKWETMDDVTLIEPFAEPRILTVSAPRYVEVTDGEVEKRLEALVEAEEPPPAPIEGELVEATATVIEVAEDGTASDSDEEKVIGFCARCRDKREVLNPARTQTKKGKAAIRGTCQVCGAGMFVFISEEK
jgi:hypothetical protein